MVLPHNCPIAKWLRHWSLTPAVVGSNPTRAVSKRRNNMLNQRRLRNLKWRYLRCPNCGKVCMLPNNTYERKRGHIKTMVCFFCSKKVDMIEMKEWDV